MNNDIQAFINEHKKTYSESFLSAIKSATDSDKKFENFVIEVIRQMNANNYKLLEDYHQWLTENYNLTPRQ